MDFGLDPADYCVRLAEAEHEPTFGGKAVSLGAAMRAGLPVPHGIAVGAPLVAHIAAGNAAALAHLREHAHLPDGRLAVRSSAVGEDSSSASFAGQHTTVLNVTRPSMHDAVAAVWQSGQSAAALAYRARKGILAPPAVGVVVQLLIEPVAAGVLFTRNPMTGAAERLIEASWGLGEAVVSGVVTPDCYRLSAEGALLEATPGDKDIQIWYDEGDGTTEIAVAQERRYVLCLETEHLRGLHTLASRCQQVYGDDLDIEWALASDGRLHLLQARPITTVGGA